MRCYKCKSELTDSDICPQCGSDVSAYKGLVKASNAYYNQGLLKAQIRDLTGAVFCLKTSLSLNKYNTKARNLLGLVYYEMGEVVEALTQWVLSKNYKPEKNAADVFIKKVQSNQNKLESMNQTIKKFNICLNYAKEGSDDVAKIQLKKVITNNPKFIKAHLLLVLLYMKKDENDKARKIVRNILNIDRGNTLALKYLKELNEIEIDKKAIEKPDIAAKPKKEKKKPKVTERQALTGHDVIIPRGGYKEPSNGAITVINLLAGVAIGAALIWFLILPSKLNGVTSNNNKTIKEYAAKISESNAEITRLTSQVESLTNDLSRLEGGNSANEENAQKYSMLLEAVNYAISGNAVEAASILTDIDVTTLATDGQKNVYGNIWTQTFLTAYESLYNQAMDMYNRNDFVGSSETFAKAYRINPTADAAFYAGESYFKAEKKEEAKTYFNIIISNFQNTRYMNPSNEYLGQIG